MNESEPSRSSFPSARIPFVVLQGDVNGDGIVDAVDALGILRYLAGLPPTVACPQAAFNVYQMDVRRTGTISEADAQCVLDIVAGLPETPQSPRFPPQTLA